ncbi:MAG: hypothetical protein NUV74_09635 [Candidatus Brocadiaceae bacterium]|nr:hypothetical protein [Candidatus Brocadiaceae bacterium]
MSIKKGRLIVETEDVVLNVKSPIPNIPVFSNCGPAGQHSSSTKEEGTTVLDLKLRMNQVGWYLFNIFQPYSVPFPNDVIYKLMNWRHYGFSMHNGVRVTRDDEKTTEQVEYYLWDSGCTNNEIGELFDVSYSREQIHCYGNIVGGFGVKILALIHPTLLQFL